MPIRCRCRCRGLPSSVEMRLVNLYQRSIVMLFLAAFLTASTNVSWGVAQAFTPVMPVIQDRLRMKISLEVAAGWGPGSGRINSALPWEFLYFPKWDAVMEDTSTISPTTTTSHGTMTKAHVDVHLVDLTWLKPHEEVVSEQHVEDLLEATQRWGAYVSPLLVDRVTGTILDGHHRYHVGKRLGLNRVPAVLVKYEDDPLITVDVWDGCGVKALTKRQVLAMALSPYVFPPKTSKHTFVDDLPPIRVPLTILQ
jgi:hypothetical protein